MINWFTNPYSTVPDKFLSSLGLLQTGATPPDLPDNQTILRVDENQRLLVKFGDNDEIVVATASVPQEGLSRYTNTYVVDQNGNGDFETLAEAVAAVPEGAVLWLFGLHSTGSGIAINKSLTIWLGAASSIQGTFGNTMFTIATGKQLNIVSPFLGGIFSAFAKTFEIAGSGTLNAYGAFLSSGGSTCIDFLSTSGKLNLNSCQITGNGTAIHVPGALAEVDVRNCVIEGSTYVVDSDVLWNNAPFYHNRFGPSGGSHNNFNSDAGVADGTNVFES